MHACPGHPCRRSHFTLLRYGGEVNESVLVTASPLADDLPCLIQPVLFVSGDYSGLFGDAEVSLFGCCTIWPCP